MYRTARALHLNERFIYKPVNVPFRTFLFRQIHNLSHRLSEGCELRHGLPVHLTDPLFRAVGSYNKQRQRTIKRFRHSRSKVQHRRTRCTAHCYRASFRFNKSKSEESSTALVSHFIAVHADRRKRMYKRSIPTSRTHNHLAYALLLHQRGQLQYILLR